MGVMENIRTRLQSGATPAELIGEGFSRSSVYAANQGLKRRSPKKIRQATSLKAIGQTEPEASASLRSVSSDPEIAELQRRVAKKRLEWQLEAPNGLVISDEVLSVYREMKRQGYPGSIKDFIDQSVAITIRRFRPNVDKRLLEWAERLVDDDQPADRKPDQYEEFMARWERIARLKAISKMI